MTNNYVSDLNDEEWAVISLLIPSWSTVHYYFRRWKLEGVWFKIHEQLREALRKEYKKRFIQLLELWILKLSRPRKKGAMWL